MKDVLAAIGGITIALIGVAIFLSIAVGIRKWSNDRVRLEPITDTTDTKNIIARYNTLDSIASQMNVPDQMEYEQMAWYSCSEGFGNDCTVMPDLIMVDSLYSGKHLVYFHPCCNDLIEDLQIYLRSKDVICRDATDFENQDSTINCYQFTASIYNGYSMLGHRYQAVYIFNLIYEWYEENERF